MRKASRLFPLALLSVALGSGAAASNPRVFDVTQFGAVADGITPASGAVNKAVDAATAAGGGTVCFPAGTLLCGSIHPKSNVRRW